MSVVGKLELTGSPITQGISMIGSYLNRIEQAFEHAHNLHSIIAATLRVHKHDQWARVWRKFDLQTIAVEENEKKITAHIIARG